MSDCRVTKEEAIELLKAYVGNEYYTEKWQETCRMAIDALNGQAEPVTSEWVWDDDAIDWGIGAYVCKRCHGRNENIHAGKQGNPYAWAGSQFCPNCGAKMKVGDQNE